uniref:BCLAF1 and THRAP3 family member 3 n=1 Tax=Salarias fasciatus TaxID=181472 RepID=A0A672H618_SALFA
MEHGHREPPRWEEFDGEAGPGGPRHQRRSEERFRHGSRERRLQDPHEARRSSPPPPDRFPGRFENRGGPPKYRGRGASRPMRNRYNHNRGARTGPPRTQIRFPQSSQEYEELPEEHGGRYRPLREEHVDPPPGEDSWVEQDRQQDPDPKMSRHKQHGWNRPELDSGGAAAEETLTIKVDMSRPAPLSSTSSYSADRQLSLDLVHVGRQRLDFLPMLEHSGTFRESNMHSGTFAQEIISLVHQVKDQYFRGGGLTLNQRFSAPPNSSCSEDEAQELTLDRRFSSNRGFSLNISSLLDEDDEAPLLSRLPPVQGLSQPVRGPGDLRHDLERRRQEKLEEVKVTIPGRSRAQRPPAAAR